MAEILVKAVDHTYPDTEADLRGAYKRGYPVVVMPNGHSWGLAERLPTFVVIKVPAATVAQVESYAQPWRRVVDFTIDSSDLTTDTHTTTVRATSGVSASLNGLLTRAQVEQFLTRWNAVVQSVSAGAVTFTINIYDAIRSQGFWATDRVALATFFEENYTQSGGIHRVTCDYAALGIPARVVGELNTADHAVLSRGGAIVSHAGTVITFDIARADVRAQFQAEVKQRLDRVVGRRQWRFTAATVAAAEAAGGELTLTIAEAQAALVDQLTE